jgi:hypothetical protein
VTYLPILFVCLVGGECDFIFAKPVSSRDVCETMNAESELHLDTIGEVVAYKSACIPISKDHGPRTKV